MKNLFGDGVIKPGGITLLEITAAAAAYQQGVTGKHHGVVGEHITETTVSVSRSGAITDCP